ncbi:MAG: transcriptional activator NhaR [Phycisphaerae bacterium]|nr:transcriptional activator NhaR [Phycisphaerae bacterium]
MDWLNYHHLLYFWHVARQGSIAAACEKLHLSPPTISAQVRELERSLGETLFNRVGRNLVLTEAGRVAFRYADDIFSLGREFVDVVKARSSERPRRLRVGVNDVLPKLLVYRLLEPLLSGPEPARIECVQGTPAQLLPPLSVNDLDVVLSDAPVDPQIRVRAFSHLLGECVISFFAAPKLARRLRPGFPKSLDGAPALLPAASSALRRTLDEWFDSVGVRPSIVGEFEDIALIRIFGQNGMGFFAAHEVVTKEISKGHRMDAIGSIKGRHEQIYAISVERRLKNPAVATLIDSARSTLFVS